MVVVVGMENDANLVVMHQLLWEVVGVHLLGLEEVEEVVGMVVMHQLLWEVVGVHLLGLEEEEVVVHQPVWEGVEV